MPGPISGLLRTEVETAILSDLKALGPQGFDRAALVRRFEGRGASRATLYRWVENYVSSGVPGQALARHVKSATAARIKRHKTPEAATEAVATDVAATLPAIVTLDDIAGHGGVVPAMEQLQRVLSTCQTIMDQAAGDDPTKVRAPKLSMAAGNLIRACLETGARIGKDLSEIGHAQRFHQAIFDVLREESPAMAQKVLVRLRQLQAEWTAGAR